MTYAPGTLLALRTYLVPKTGLSLVSLGIVGDAAHARRASYHNGWDRVLAHHRTAATDYSIRTARDRAYPRTNAAMAIDIGNFRNLRQLSASIVEQARRNAPGTRDMREIIYSPDGRTVLRWDRERGFDSAPKTGEADNSHLYHTHISYYRDSERREKLTPFRRYFDPVDYWGSEIAADIKRAYPYGTAVASKLRALGISFGTVINYVDLEAGCRKRRINYGTSVQLIDVRALMRAGTGAV